MDFEIKFNMDNSAFDIIPEREIKAILTRIADRVINGLTTGTIRDINGNNIGMWIIND